MTDWCSEPLSEVHDTACFDCGNELLGTWLRQHALRAQRANTARTSVWTAPEDKRVVAYYSIAPTQILRHEVGGSFAAGYSVLPAYLLARLALDRSLHGQGLGAELLVDALETIVTAAGIGGGRLIVVDAIDESAAAFYRRHDFEPVKGNDRRLVMKVATARRALALMRISVTPDESTRLVSIVLDLPDGTTVPVVASTVEAEAIGRRLLELVDEARGEPEVRINFNQVLCDVLGRDPLRS